MLSTGSADPGLQPGVKIISSEPWRRGNFHCKERFFDMHQKAISIFGVDMSG